MFGEYYRKYRDCILRREEIVTHSVRIIITQYASGLPSIIVYTANYI